MALVTIGIPSYQRPQPLERCLATLTAQTFKDIRILVSDDGSPDPQVSEVMQAAATADPRVVCLYQNTNIGMFANFWLLLQAADTPWLARLGKSAYATYIRRVADSLG